MIRTTKPGNQSRWYDVLHWLSSQTSKADIPQPLTSILFSGDDCLQELTNVLHCIVPFRLVRDCIQHVGAHQADPALQSNVPSQPFGLLVQSRQRSFAYVW